MKPKISIITLGVNDMNAMRTFYEKGLGLAVHEASNNDITFFMMDNMMFSLYPTDKLAEDIGIAGKGSGFSGVTIAHNEPSKEKVDETIELARAAGAEIVKEPQEVFWGGYSGYFRDPEGYLWEIAYNPFMDLT